MPSALSILIIMINKYIYKKISRWFQIQVFFTWAVTRVHPKSSNVFGTL